MLKYYISKIQPFHSLSQYCSIQCNNTEAVIIVIMSIFSEQDSIAPSDDSGKISHIVILIAMDAEASPLLQSYKLVKTFIQNRLLIH